MCIRDSIKDSGADLITVHVEACTHLDRVIGQIKELGLKAGAALKMCIRDSWMQ